MVKALIFAIRIDGETKAALERAAKDDMRPASSLALKILTDWLRARSYLQ